jgi:SAM-dependent methyltransferase
MNVLPVTPRRYYAAARALLLGKVRRRRDEALYRRRSYLDAYAAHTDLRVERDPQFAIGGAWEELGQHQFDFLVRIGLAPRHTLLDIGCGTLRGGRHFIRYLDAGNYTGMDISAKAVAYGRRLVEQEGLSEKEPRLLVSTSKDLRFREFEGETFDYLLAQSVFTHLRPEHIEECFEHVGQIMKSTSAFFFTFTEAEEFDQTGLKDFCYPRTFFQSLAEECGFELRDRSSAYDHPRGQRMAVLSTTPSPARSDAR